VQVKRRADKITVDGLRAFMALLGSQDVGIFIATGGFTSEAQREVRGQENGRISLIDLQRFFDLWIEHYTAVQEEDRQRLPLTAVHFLAPRDQAGPNRQLPQLLGRPPDKPQSRCCGMVRRTGTLGRTRRPAT
jgi:Restriction endonuclease